MMSSKHCVLCRLNLSTKLGSLANVVPFFRETRNKEFLPKANLQPSTTPVVINDLINSIGINTSSFNRLTLSERQSTYVCRKCARKVFNCHSLYHEIVLALPGSTDQGDDEETLPKNDTTSKRAVIRSPSGLTPSKKKTKERITRDNPVSKRTLPYESQVATINDEISSLMNLPLEANEEFHTIVKVNLINLLRFLIISIICIYI